MCGESSSSHTERFSGTIRLRRENSAGSGLLPLCCLCPTISADLPFIPNLERRPYLLMRTKRTRRRKQAKPTRPTAMETWGEWHAVVRRTSLAPQWSLETCTFPPESVGKKRKRNPLTRQNPLWESEYLIWCVFLVAENSPSSVMVSQNLLANLRKLKQHHKSQESWS